MAATGGGSSGAGAVRAGRAFVEISANDKGVMATLDRIKAKFTSFGASIAKFGAGMTLAGGGVFGPLAGLAHSAIEAGSAATDMAERLNTTTETITALGYAASLAGGSLEDVEANLGKMQKAIADDKLGLGALVNEDIDTQLNSIAEAIKAVDNPTQQAAMAMEIFGKSGRKMLPFLKEGAAGLAKLRDKAGRTGAIIGADEAANMDKIGDALTDVWTVVKSIGRAIGVAFLGGAGTIESFSEKVIAVGEAVRGFIERNSELIQVVGIAAAGVTAAGIAFATLGGAIMAVGAALPLIASGFAAIGAAITAAFSPLGLMIGGFAAVTASVGYLLYEFTSMGQIFETAWGGIAASIKKGDLGGAMKIAWLGIKLTWHTGIAWLEEMWIGFKFTFFRIWEEVTSGMTIALYGALAEIQGAFKGTKLEGTFKSVFGDFKSLEDAAKKAHEAAMVELDSDEGWQKFAANIDANNTKAELEAAVAAAKAVQEQVEKKAGKVVALATAVKESGVAKGMFGSGSLAQSLAYADGGNRIEKNTERTAKGVEELAKIIDNAPPLVWAA